MIVEKWLPVVGFPYYEVSSLGNVRSIDRIVVDKNGHSRPRTGVLLSQTTMTGRSYKCVTLSDRKNYLVHVLVCTAFHGPKPFPDWEVSHDDNDGGNNREDNLLWETHLINMRRKQKDGTQSQDETCNLSKLTVEQVLRIRELIDDGFSDKEIALEFNVSRRNVNYIKHRKNWGHV